MVRSIGFSFPPTKAGLAKQPLSPSVSILQIFFSHSPRREQRLSCLGPSMALSVFILLEPSGFHSAALTRDKGSPHSHFPPTEKDQSNESTYQDKF